MHEVPHGRSTEGDSRRNRAEVVILDNVFPSRLSGFRRIEYTYLLEHLPTAEVWTSGQYIDFAQKGDTIEAELAVYGAENPSLVDRIKIRPENKADRGEAGFAYTIFLCQAFHHLPFLERMGLGFAFTLYPGGGFEIDRPLSDFKLRSVCESPWFRKMIVTQRVTLDYVLRRGFCRPDQIAFIPGCPANCDDRPTPHRPEFGRDKDTLDLCFVAHKYEPRGVSKGYDMFVATAERLAPKFPHVRFHVAGGFTPDDVDVSALGDRVRFYGHLSIDDMPRFFAGMDAVLSQNVPFVLTPGSFDGFPTGCCTEAALAGTALFCTDALDENHLYQPGQELVLLPYHVPAAAYLIGAWLEQPQRLKELGRQGQAAFQRHYSPAAQLAPRLQTLRECLRETAAMDLPRRAA